MAKQHPQVPMEVWRLTSGCFTANGASSASMPALGYGTLRGYITTDASLITGSGIALRQSVDGGANWDYVSASDTIGAGASAACYVTIIGDAVRVDLTCGDDEASAMRFGFWLWPE